MDSQNKLTAEQQINLLRQLTESSGCIHEAQLLQLKLWPFLLYPELDVKYEMSIDQEERVVSYKFTFPTVKTPAYLKKKMQILEKDFHWLLGDTWQLRALDSKRVIFEGTRKKFNKIAEETWLSP